MKYQKGVELKKVIIIHYSVYPLVQQPGFEWAGLEQLPARSLLEFAFYRPVRAAKRITCPTMIIAATKDSLIPIKAVRNTARKIEKVNLVEYPIGHFEIYQCKYLQQAVTQQLGFFREAAEMNLLISLAGAASLLQERCLQPDFLDDMP